MESKQITRDVQVACGESRSNGFLVVHYFSSSERLRRVWKVLLVGLLVLPVCVAIPGLHFVLLPLWCLTVPVMSYRVYGVTSCISAAQVRCARCSGELTQLSSQERYPLYERCLTCNRENTIVAIEAGGA